MSGLQFKKGDRLTVTRRTAPVATTSLVYPTMSVTALEDGSSGGESIFRGTNLAGKEVRFYGLSVVEVVPARGECKGKAAARALAVLVLTTETRAYLQANDPKALEQAEAALVPFGHTPGTYVALPALRVPEVSRG